VKVKTKNLKVKQKPDRCNGVLAAMKGASLGKASTDFKICNYNARSQSYDF
jgi:hypothetical protein